MKKTDFILVGLVLVIILVAILSGKGNKTYKEIEYPLQLYGEVGLNQITYSEYEEMVLNEKPFVVVIERDGCYYCQQYMPLLKEYVDEAKIAVEYIDTDTLSKEEYNKLVTKNKYLKTHQWGTPTTLFMVGDRIVDYIGGFVEKDSIEAFFKDRVIMGD